jgi:hypothetical protein
MIGKCRWKLLDFALLKRNSVSFFDIEKPETAVSKWSRARMRAAKVPLVFFRSDIIIPFVFCISSFLGLHYISDTGVVFLSPLGWQRSLQG